MPTPLSIARLGGLIAALVIAVTSACSRPIPTKDGTVELSDGARLRYRIVGTGADTAVVLHGGPALDLTYLLQPLTPLASNRTLIFYDQRGRGQSSVRDTMPASFDRDLEDLDAVRRHFRLARVALIGHHYGAALAALYAEHHPLLVRRILMISPFQARQNYVYDFSRIPIDSAAQADFWAALAAGRDSSDPASFCREFWGFQLTPAVVTTPSVVRRLASDVCTNTSWTFRRRQTIARQVSQSLGNHWDWRPALGQVRVPVLIVNGTGDESNPSSPDARRDAVFLHSAETWAAALPNARLATLHGPAFFPWLESPQRFRNMIDTFLGGAWPGDARVTTAPPSPS